MIVLICITIILSIILALLEISGKKLNKFYKYFILFLMLQSGFRTLSTNYDNYVYKNIFEKSIPKLGEYFSFINNFDFFEKGYILINCIAKSLNMNYRGMFLVVSLISLSIIGITIKKYCKYKYIGLYIYITNFYYINDFIIIRSGIAMGLILLSIIYLKNYKKFIFITFIAASFHRIAYLNIIPFIIIKFLNLKKLIFNWKFIYLILFLSFLCGILSPIQKTQVILSDIFGGKFTYYLNEFPTRGNYRKLLVYIPILLYFLKNNKKYIEDFRFYDSYIYILMANITTLILVENIYFNRIPYMFSISKIYLYDMLIAKNKKYIYFILFLELIVLFWTLRIYIETLF
ncbi:EpsG family protein [Cetobacterium ceti]|uniref:EpsG family protein n=1 Tax=Cetobacterium ceti TaxID=180163 RepID=A0A1T4LSW5_9FUSO|nr:EpsG family protein [Cetobacterium ceti]SJZ57757.1 EpsG family protein [Cetobacterium ceti]